LFGKQGKKFSLVLKTMVIIPMFSNKGRNREIIPHTTHEHMTTRQHDNKTTRREHTHKLYHTQHTTTRQQDDTTTRQQHENTHTQIPRTTQHNTTQHNTTQERRKEKDDTHKTHYTRKKKKNGRYHRRRRNSYWK
jgi:hypothetical protein